MPEVSRFYGIIIKNRAQKMVKEWLTEHKEELQEMWKTQKIVKLPPLKD